MIATQGALFAPKRARRSSTSPSPIELRRGRYTARFIGSPGAVIQAANSAGVSWSADAKRGVSVRLDRVDEVLGAFDPAARRLIKVVTR
jgi:hypothetical protein